MASSPREDNRVPGLVAKSDADNTPVILEADPSTKRLKVNSTITGSISATVDTTGLATDSNQTNGSQKTQIVDAGGEAATVTGGKLDVNATASLAGETLPVSGATEGVAVAIVDGSGNQITSFGGGTQYTEGDTDASITGTALMMEDGSNTLRAAPGNVANGLDVDVTRVQGTVTVDGSGVTQPVSHAALTELAAAIDTEVQVDIVGALPAGNNNIGDVDVATLPSTVHSADYDTGGGTDTTLAFGLAVPASGGAAVVPGDATAGLKVDLGADNDVTITSLPNEGQQTMANSISVAIASNQSAIPVTDNSGSLTVDDGGTSLTVDGTVTVQGDVGTLDQLDLTNTNPLAVAITDGNGDQITSFGGGTQYTEDAAAAANPTGTAPMLVRADSPAGITTTDGDNVAQRGTDYGAAYVTLLDTGGSPVAVGGGTQYTEGDTDASITGTALLFEGAADTLVAAPGTAANGLDVDVTRVSGTVTVDGSGVTQPVSNAGLTELAAAINGSSQMDVNIAANGASLATSAKQDTMITALQLIDDPVQVLGTDTYTEATSRGMTIGAVRRDADTTLVNTTNEFGPLQMDANGRLKVEAFSGETLPVSLTSTTVTGTVQVQSNSANLATQTTAAAIQTAVELIDDPVATDDTTTHSTGSTKVMGIGAVATPTDASVNANDIGMPAMTTDRKLHVAVMDALPAGTAAIGKLAANSGVDIGDVDVTSVVPGTGATSLGKAIDTATGATDTGVLSLGTRDDVLTTLTPADADNVTFRTDKWGATWVEKFPMESDLATMSTSHVKKYYTNSGAVTDGIVWSPASGKRWFITHLSFNVSAACTVTFEDDLAGGDSAVWKGELAANSGAVLTFPEVPMFSGEDAADLLVTTSAGNIYVTVVGYEI